MRLALFSCGTPPPALAALHGDYSVLFTNLFANSYRPDAFVLDSYSVVDLQYPSDHDLDKYNAIVITGSAADAFEDIEWITKLVSYMANVVNTKPSIKIIGICFGHQIIARAMGEQVCRNDGRWEISPVLITLTDIGKTLFGVDSFHIEQMHQDHVPSVPAGFHLLGSTPVSLNQGMVRFYGDSASPTASPDNIHILTLQGHPEFTEPITTGLIEARAAKGIIDKETAADGLNRRFWPNDGTGVIGRTIWNVLGVKIPPKA
ncbi:Class I glutamine amidotransferase-like protein [Amanita muscaria]